MLIIDKFLYFWKDPIYKWLLIALSGLFIFACVTEFIGKAPKPDAPTNFDSIDTIIPAGFVLVPIDLQNAESMSSIIGDFALVDLYSIPIGKDNKGQKVGQRLRLLRAPLNRNLFAVLVPENETGPILNHGGSFFAVIQNKDQPGMGSMNKEIKKKNRIEYYKEPKIGKPSTEI
jgi:hypothetical protein